MDRRSASDIGGNAALAFHFGGAGGDGRRACAGYPRAAGSRRWCVVVLMSSISVLPCPPRARFERTGRSMPSAVAILAAPSMRLLLWVRAVPNTVRAGGAVFAAARCGSGRRRCPFRRQQRPRGAVRVTRLRIAAQQSDAIDINGEPPRRKLRRLQPGERRMAIERFNEDELMSKYVIHNGTVYMSGQVADDPYAGFRGPAHPDSPPSSTPSSPRSGSTARTC